MGVPASARWGSCRRTLARSLAFLVRLLRTAPRAVKRALILFPLLPIALLLIPTPASEQQPGTRYGQATVETSHRAGFLGPRRAA